MVHDNLKYTSIVRLAGYNSSAQLAGDSRTTLYPGYVKTLLHSTTCAAYGPILFIYGILYMFSFDEL